MFKGQWNEKKKKKPQGDKSVLKVMRGGFQESSQQYIPRRTQQNRETEKACWSLHLGYN